MNVKLLKIKVVLEDTQPPVWRRIWVKNDITFHKLHQMIQAVMGWQDRHLYEFRFGNSYIGLKGPELEENEDIIDSKDFYVGKLPFKPGFSFTYIYDFGDDWRHAVEIEDVLEPQEGESYPVCTDGSRRCPPEDIGGAWAFEEFLEVIMNPAHPSYEEFLRYWGGNSDPEWIDFEQINQALAALGQ